MHHLEMLKLQQVTDANGRVKSLEKHMAIKKNIRGACLLHFQTTSIRKKNCDEANNMTYLLWTSTFLCSGGSIWGHWDIHGPSSTGRHMDIALLEASIRAILSGSRKWSNRSSANYTVPFWHCSQAKPVGRVKGYTRGSTCRCRPNIVTLGES